MTTVPAVKKITVAHKTLEMRLTTEQLLFTPLNGYNTVRLHLKYAYETS